MFIKIDDLYINVWQVQTINVFYLYPEGSVPTMGLMINGVKFTVFTGTDVGKFSDEDEVRLLNSLRAIMERIVQIVQENQTKAQTETIEINLADFIKEEVDG